MPIRFDVVAVWWPEPSEQPSRIEYYEHAFEPPDSYQSIGVDNRFESASPFLLR